MFPTGFWDSPLWKEAARAGLRQISKMVGQGNISGASRLATTPGVLKPSVAGSQIKHLGQGSEGLATMVAHPEHGVAVRKLYDPRGMSGTDMIARKEQAGRAIGDNPHFAKFLGSAQTPHGGQMHFNEFVQQGQAPTGAAAAQSIKHTQTQANRALNQAGFAGGKDIRKGNMVYDQASGSHKVIDYIPAKQNEFMRMPKKMENVLSTTPEAPSPFNANYASEGTSRGGMLSRLIGGKSEPGGVRSGMALDSTRAAGGLGAASTMPAPAKSPQAGIATGVMGGAPARPPQADIATGMLGAPKAKPAQANIPTAPLSPIKPPATTPMRAQKPVTPAPISTPAPKPALTPLSR